MAINFPDSPSNGDTQTINGSVYTYNSTTSKWDVSGDNTTNVTVSDTAPSGAVAGDQWFNSTDGSLYVYYNDGSSSQWVGISGPTGASGSSGSSVTAYDSDGVFPSSGNTVGDFAFASDTKALYNWDGAEWDRISSGPQIGPRYTTTPASTLSLNTDGSTSTLTAVAVDESGFPITYDWDAYSGSTIYSASSLPPQLTAVSESNGVFSLTPSTSDSDSGTVTFRTKASDGVLFTPAITTLSLAFTFSSPTQAYNAGLSDGLVTFQNDDIAGGNEFQVRYASHGGKGWFEMAFFADGDPYSGSNLNWPWNTSLDTHFLVTSSSSNTGWNGSINYGSEYGLRNRNAQGSLGGSTNTSTGLDYAKNVGVLLFGNAFTCDGVLITAKSSKTANGVAPNSNVTQYDAEGNTIYPLNTPSHMPNTALKTAFHNYWMGLAPAVNWEDGTYSSGQNRDHWQITSGSTFKPYVSMNNRAGSVNNDEWHIATGYHGPSGASTYRTNIGYRNSSTYGYSNVGTWKSQPSTSEIIPWASNHVLSIWVSGS